MPCNKPRFADSERDQCLGGSPGPEIFRHVAPITETPENNRLNIYSILERTPILVFEDEFES